MADFYWIGPAGGNWSIIGNWSSTSGGASNGAIPGPSDSVFFTPAVNNGSVVDIPFTITNLTMTSSLGGTIANYYTGSLTINSAIGYDYPLVITGTLDIGSPPYSIAVNRVFTGTAGWKADKVINSGLRGIVTFKAGVEYRIESSFTNQYAYPSSTKYNWTYYASDTNGVYTKLTLGKNAVCNVVGSMFNIDASNGRTITNWMPNSNGDNSSCLNVLQYIRGRQVYI